MFSSSKATLNFSTTVSKNDGTINGASIWSNVCSTNDGSTIVYASSITKFYVRDVSKYASAYVSFKSKYESNSLAASIHSQSASSKS